MNERGFGQQQWHLNPMDYAPSKQQSGEQTAQDWFGPGRALAPSAPKDVAGRQWDFPQSVNIVGIRSAEVASFGQLRAFADAYDLLRLVIETRKDQIARIQWSIRAKLGQQSIDPKRLAEISRFFCCPDGEHHFSTWLRMLLEDLLVIDAPVLWCERDRMGRLIALHPMDGATIKRIVDPWGRTPRQPVQNQWPVAYQQVLKGYPAIDYSCRDIIYRARNLRAHRLYGYSPVEQIIMSVNIALRRQLYQLNYFTEGNIPESLIGVPDNWTPEQIKNYQDYWDNYFTGDAATRRRAKFVPGGVAKTFIETKEPQLKSDFDEWLARIICFAFSISPQALTSQVNRATAQTQKEVSEEEGLRPLLQWAKHLCDDIICKEFGEENIEFVWDADSQLSESEQQSILCNYVGGGIMTPNEARCKLGLAAIPDPAASQLQNLQPQKQVSQNPNR